MNKVAMKENPTNAKRSFDLTEIYSAGYDDGYDEGSKQTQENQVKEAVHQRIEKVIKEGIDGYFEGYKDGCARAVEMIKEGYDLHNLELNCIRDLLVGPDHDGDD